MVAAVFAGPSVLDLPAIAALRPDDFRDTLLSQTWHQIKEAHRDGRPVDLADIAATVAFYSGQRSESEVAAELVTVCMTGHSAITTPEAAADRIRREARRRKLGTVFDAARKALDDPTVDLNQLLETIAAYRETEPQDVGPAFIGSAEFAAGDYRLEYLIPGVLVRGQPGVICGPQKSLKTNIAVDLALSLGWGVPFLGYFRVPTAVRVGFISGESGEATLQETAARIAAAKGYDLADAEDRVFWRFTVPNLRAEGVIAEMTAWIEQHKFDVLVCDPFYLMSPADPENAGNLFAMGEALMPLLALAHSTRCTLLLIHHARKNRKEPFSPLSLEDIAWSGVQEFSRQWLLINRRSAYDPDRGGDHELWFSAGGSAGHSVMVGLNISEGIGSAKASIERLARLSDADAGQVREARQAAEDQRRAVRRTSRMFDVLTASRLPGSESSKITVDTLSDETDLTLEGDRRQALDDLGGVEPFHFPIALPNPDLTASGQSSRASRSISGNPTTGRGLTMRGRTRPRWSPISTLSASAIAHAVRRPFRSLTRRPGSVTRRRCPAIGLGLPSVT